MSVASLVGYTAGPYRDARGPWFIKEKIARAERTAAHFWSMGVPMVCPHLNTAMMEGIAPDTVWLQGLRTIMTRCDFVVLVGPEWYRSTGTIEEISTAYERNIPIFSDRTDFKKIAAYAHGNIPLTDFLRGETVRSQWCNTHIQPALDLPLGVAGEALSRKVIESTIFRLEVGFETRDRQFTEEELDTMNRALFSLAPLCCLMGDEAVAEAWGEAHEAKGAKN